MKNTNLKEIFDEVKAVICKYNYYIYTTNKIFCITNNEKKIPHLMGLQYIGRPGAFEGERGAYLIKSGKLQYDSINKLVAKYYKKVVKQKSIEAMVYNKIDNITQIKKMFSSESDLYLYDVDANPYSELKTDYLLVNHQSEIVLQLGLIRSNGRKVEKYHCNSFLVDYKSNNDYDIYFRNLTQKYTIQKIIRENKFSQRREIIYRSEKASERELQGIRRMLDNNDILADDKLVDEIYNINTMFGKFHTFDELINIENLRIYSLHLSHVCDIIFKYECVSTVPLLSLWRLRPGLGLRRIFIFKRRIL